jgi:hypothetical protein
MKQVNNYKKLYGSLCTAATAYPTKQLPHLQVWPEHIKWDNWINIDLPGLIICSCYQIHQMKSSLINVTCK